MGLNVNVYRWSLGDCTNHGISEKATELCIVNVEGPTNPYGDVPAALLIPGAYPDYPIVVPAVPVGTEAEDLYAATRVIVEMRSTVHGPGFVEVGRKWKAEPRWTMSGGNIASSHDSRWHRAVEQITGGRSTGHVSIHDRIETREESDRCSR